MNTVALPKELKEELVLLFETMDSIRHEIASIRHPLAREDRLRTMAGQLDAIVPATEEATHKILSSAENIEALLNEISQRTDDSVVSEKVDGIGANVAELFQACSFQDITGQWIRRVAGSLKHIDERITALVDLWGRDDLAQAPIANDEPVEDPDAKLMNGPQINGGTSQDEIDKLFD